jgi:hypothetical protein
MWHEKVFRSANYEDNSTQSHRVPVAARERRPGTRLRARRAAGGSKPGEAALLDSVEREARTALDAVKRPNRDEATEQGRNFVASWKNLSAGASCLGFLTYGSKP